MCYSKPFVCGYEWPTTWMVQMWRNKARWTAFPPRHGNSEYLSPHLAINPRIIYHGHISIGYHHSFSVCHALIPHLLNIVWMGPATIEYILPTPFLFELCRRQIWEKKKLVWSAYTSLSRVDKWSVKVWWIHIYCSKLYRCTYMTNSLVCVVYIFCVEWVVLGKF